ncbi:transposase [Sporosarcina sp. P16b]|uniref:transposase n=1 Tax=Sporosarcina sp. P16b TaxID=2048261 RepID=UPI000C16B816|nr:transposase [Sporosarcina sp. P16b]PIC70847.1 transposase [Sporosarcina sp. P16b]
MARRKRNWRPNAYYHVVMRGNNRQNIYATEEDMLHVMRCIGHASIDYHFTIVAFCIMTNHYHILLQSEDNLSNIMRHINRKYSDYYAKRYDYVGQLYQGRYYSKEVKSTYAMLAVSRYIHRNPIATKTPMVKHLAEYPFSTFPNYHSSTPSPYPYLDTSKLPDCLPPPFEKTTAAYVTYCLMETEEILNIYNSRDILEVPT